MGRQPQSTECVCLRQERIVGDTCGSRLAVRGSRVRRREHRIGEPMNSWSGAAGHVCVRVRAVSAGWGTWLLLALAAFAPGAASLGAQGVSTTGVAGVVRSARDGDAD